ncbi:MAG TPA: TraC family protein, partial [Candidatus Saccharimonadales bacterium]|nr:TraC family protein [Candidatus Saccharimonadales bacterium]
GEENFELQSSDEQDALIDSYQSFLNSLAMPIQIIVRVRELDIEHYLEDFQASRAEETQAVYKKQLANYSAFIRQLVAGSKILSRRFYVVISYDNKINADFPTVKEQLLLQQEMVMKGLEKLGMTARPLQSLEILDLFYSFYQPDKAKIQPLTQAIIKQTNDLTDY